MPLGLGPISGQPIASLPASIVLPKYRTSTVGGQTTASSTVAATITPVIGDLLIVFCSMSGSTNLGTTCADNNGGTYTQIGTALYNTSGDLMSAFVRTSLLANTTSTTVTVTTGSGTCAAGETCVVAISGMLRSGIAAILQSANQANQFSLTTPAPAFGASAQTANITVGALAIASSSAPNATQPTGWTEQQDVTAGVGPNGAALEIATRDSGFTGTTITWGGFVGSAYASYILELDTTGVPNTSFDPFGTLGFFGN